MDKFLRYNHMRKFNLSDLKVMSKELALESSWYIVYDDRELHIVHGQIIGVVQIKKNGSVTSLKVHFETLDSQPSEIIMNLSIGHAYSGFYQSEEAAQKHIDMLDLMDKKERLNRYEDAVLKLRKEIERIEKTETNEA